MYSYYLKKTFVHNLVVLTTGISSVHMVASQESGTTYIEKLDKLEIFRVNFNVLQICNKLESSIFGGIGT